MKTRPAAPWGRLAPLAGIVLALHAVLLEGAAPLFAVVRQSPVPRFTMRAVEQIPPAVIAGVPGGTASLRIPEPPPSSPAPRAPRGPTVGAAQRNLAPDAAERRLAVSTANPDVTALFPPPPAAAAPAPDTLAPPILTAPPPATHHYEVTIQARGGQVLHGDGRLDWRHDGRAYELRLELSGGTLTPRAQSSRGQVTTHGLAPDYFHDKGRGEQATHFDRDGGRVVFSANRPQAALAEGMQDRLSVLMQLAMLLAADPARIVAGARIVLPTAGTREAGDWTFEVVGIEDLDLPGGRVHAVKLERPPRSTWDQRMELWLAPGQDYAPVRLRLTNPDGGAADQRWSSTYRG